MLLLKLKLKMGDIYNSQVVEDFPKQNASVLPPAISASDIELNRDLKMARSISGSTYIKPARIFTIDFSTQEPYSG
jgi:hypothetical protein